LAGKSKEIVAALSDMVIWKQDNPEGLEGNDNVSLKTQSGLLVARTSVEGGSLEEFSGVVLAVGPDVSILKKGDNIVVGKYNATPCLVGGIPFRVSREECVILVRFKAEKDHEVNEHEFVLKEAK